MSDERIIPACEDFSAIAARPREIKADKQRELEREEPPIDYGCYDGA